MRNSITIRVALVLTVAVVAIFLSTQPAAAGHKVSQTASHGALAPDQGLSFKQVPRDIATGQASGKRMYKPVKIIKEWGAASPQ